MERKSYVYKITCKINGNFYFGSSFKAKSDYYWGSGRKIKEQIAKYGKENFVKEILGEFDDRTESHRVENEYIEQFRHDDKCLNKRLDYHFGAYGEESRAKISAASAIAKRGYKNPMYGKTLSEEHRSKLSAAHLGKHLSEEHRSKLSAVHLGKPHPHGKHWRKNPVTGKREWYD